MSHALHQPDVRLVGEVGVESGVCALACGPCRLASEKTGGGSLGEARLPGSGKGISGDKQLMSV